MVIGTAVKTDLRNGGEGTITANWLKTRQVGKAQA